MKKPILRPSQKYVDKNERPKPIIIGYDFSASISQKHWDEFEAALKKAVKPLTKLEKALK